MPGGDGDIASHKGVELESGIQVQRMSPVSQFLPQGPQDPAAPGVDPRLTAMAENSPMSSWSDLALG